MGYVCPFEVINETKFKILDLNIFDSRRCTNIIIDTIIDIEGTNVVYINILRKKMELAKDLTKYKEEKQVYDIIEYLSISTPKIF